MQQIKIKYCQNKLLNLADIKLSQHTRQHIFSIYPNYAQNRKHSLFPHTKCKHVFIARSDKQPELLLADELFYSGGSK